MPATVIAPGQTPAVVLSCMGAPYGDLNLTRSLGEQGVPVVVLAEYPDAPAAVSRHCTRRLIVEDFTRHPQRLLPALTGLRAEFGVPPAVFPSADPDLAALVEMAPSLAGIARCAVLDPALSAALSDKQRFHDLAAEKGLPVPRTIALSGLSLEQALEAVVAQAQFPLIAKPATPTGWHAPSLPREIARSKAIRLDDAEALRRTLTSLAPCLGQTLVQEFIPGDDDAHFDVHAYIDGAGELRALYCGRKWRINPPHAGTGCYVESVHEPAAEQAALDVLARLGYRGIANINFKRHALTGEFKLLEVNPRVSHWHILPTRSGVNVPWAAYRDLTGAAPEPQGPRRTGQFYINGGEDWQAFRTYHREGSLGWGAWLGSWVRPGVVHQFWQFDDPAPALLVWRRSLARRLGLTRD